MNKNGVGVSPVAIRDAVRNPHLVEYQPSNGTWLFVGQHANVALNARGLVVTAWATSRAGHRGPR